MLTKHGTNRIKRRIGISPEYAREHAVHALENGTRPELFRRGSAFKKYLNKKIEKHKRDNIRIYGHYIYVFGEDDHLITVYPVPSRFFNFLNKRF